MQAINTFPTLGNIVEEVSTNRSDLLTVLRNNPAAYSLDTSELETVLSQRGATSTEHIKSFSFDLQRLFMQEDMQQYMFDVVLKSWEVERASTPGLPFLTHWKSFINGAGRGAMISGFSSRSEPYVMGHTPYTTDNAKSLELSVGPTPLHKMTFIGNVLADLYHVPEDVAPDTVPSVQVLLKSMGIAPTDYAEKAKQLGLVAGFGKPKSQE